MNNIEIVWMKKIYIDGMDINIHFLSDGELRVEQNDIKFLLNHPEYQISNEVMMITED